MHGAHTSYYVRSNVRRNALIDDEWVGRCTWMVST
jgi:hypothetical protein